MLLCAASVRPTVMLVERVAEMMKTQDVVMMRSMVGRWMKVEVVDAAVGDGASGTLILMTTGLCVDVLVRLLIHFSGNCDLVNKQPPLRERTTSNAMDALSPWGHIHPHFTLHVKRETRSVLQAPPGDTGCLQ